MFDSVAEQILAASIEDLATGINLHFKQEAGIDSGGLTKEFFNLVCGNLVPPSQLEDPYDEKNQRGKRKPLLRRQSSIIGCGEPMMRSLPDTSLMIANSNRPIVFYKALGRLFGMCALYSARGDNVSMPVSLSTALLKMILGLEVNHYDVRALDPLYFKNRIEFVLSPGGVEIMCQIFEEDKLFFIDQDTEEELKEGQGTRL